MPSSNKNNNKQSFGLLGSKILSPETNNSNQQNGEALSSTKDTIISIMSVLGGAAICCIDASGCLQLFPTSPKYYKAGNSSNPLVMTIADGKVITALCQVEARVSSSSYLDGDEDNSNMVSTIWIGCSNHKGIAYVTVKTEDLDEDLPKLGKVIKKKASPGSFIGAFNEAVTHLSLVPFMNRAPAVASIGNNGNCSIWDIIKRTCLVSVDMNQYIVNPNSNSSSASGFQVTAFTPHLTYDHQRPKENSTTSLWISDSTGHLSCYDAETLEPYHSYNNHFLSKKLSSPITSLLSLPELNLVCAGEEDGRLVLIRPPSKAELEHINDGLKSPDFSQFTLKHVSLPSHAGTPITCLNSASSDQLRVSVSSNGNHNNSNSASSSSPLLLWSCAMNGSVVLVDPTAHQFSPTGEFDAGAAEKLVIDVSGDGIPGQNKNSSSGSSNNNNSVFITSVASYADRITGDEVLVSGGTSRIITLQNVVRKDNTDYSSSGQQQPQQYNNQQQQHRLSIPGISLTAGSPRGGSPVNNAELMMSNEKNANSSNDDDEENPFAGTATYNDFAMKRKLQQQQEQEEEQQQQQRRGSDSEESGINSLSLAEREHISAQMRRASIPTTTINNNNRQQQQAQRGVAQGTSNNNNNNIHQSQQPPLAQQQPKPKRQQPHQTSPPKQNRSSSDDNKVNILMKRVAELELDLMQSQAVGSELTKRLLEKSKKQEQHHQEQQQKKEKSASPKRSSSSLLHHQVPKANASVQVELMMTEDQRNNGNNNTNNNSNDIFEQYVARIQELEAENVLLREKAEASKYVLSSTDVNNDNNDDDDDDNKNANESRSVSENNHNNNSEQQQQSMYRASPSRSRGRPMDDYELRCMQRLILENEKLRSDLHSLRLNGASMRSSSRKAGGSRSASQQQTESGVVTEEESHNILTVCFLTLRSVLGHHPAAEIVLAAIGDEEEEQNNQQQSASERRLSEVQTIEKLVYELACRLDPRHRGAPEEL